MGKEEKEEKEDRISVPRKEYEELRSKGMSKEERQLRSIVRDELAAALKDVFRFGEEDEEEGDEEEGGGTLKEIGKVFGLGGK